MFPLKKVISGGQTGADQAGLVAGSQAGFETGGWMPKGFKTLDGGDPELAEVFGLKEHPSDKYPPRTFANVNDSDGTIRFASDFDSPGERLTLKAIILADKPHIRVDVNDPISPEEVRQWIIDYNIKTLNVAGNSENTSPGITKFVVEFLMKVFEG